MAVSSLTICSLGSFFEKYQNIKFINKKYLNIYPPRLRYIRIFSHLTPFLMNKKSCKYSFSSHLHFGIKSHLPSFISGVFPLPSSEKFQINPSGLSRTIKTIKTDPAGLNQSEQTTQCRFPTFHVENQLTKPASP